MGTQSPSSSDNLRRLDRNPRLGTARQGLAKYQLNVVANDVAGVLGSVGGWLFDRSMAGWDVHVLLADHTNVDPLRILGVRTLELDAGLSAIRARGEQAAGLAVASDLLGTDERIDAHVRDAVRCSEAEVVLWGAGESVAGVKALVYRLGAAARRFKFHALFAASGNDASMDSFETLFRKGRAPSDSYLLPVDCLIHQG